MIWLWVVLSFACVVVLIGISRVQLQIFFSRVKDNDHFIVKISGLGGLFRWGFDIPYIQYRGLWDGFLMKTGALAKSDDELQNQKQQNITLERISKMIRWSKRLLTHVFDFTKWLEQTLKHVKCSEFRWNTRMGIGDAAETALTTGMIWGIKSSLCGYFFQHIVLQTKPKLSVQPQYNHPQFSTELICRMNVRLGYILGAVLLLVVRILKVKGGFRTWRRILSKPS